MKNILYTIALTFAFLSCKAQQPIVPLYFGGGYASTENAYYKDTNNDFNKFIGTWKHTNGNEEFTIILKKKTLVSRTLNNITYYTDYLYGEYKYVDANGVELVNTLSNISSAFTSLSDYKIFGNRILNKYYAPVCDDCTEDERRVKLNLTDPVRSYIDIKITLRTVPNASNSNINDITLVVSEGYSIVPTGQPADSRIPANDFRLIKQ
ncbi:DUF6705 family protein [Lacinutrix venerupis]|uniref:DUF6705 domain-containing protein n=1 Tax=Lacinutrix venerupis TaxID=1486034 RepID=A0AAC9LNP1_9FLAO|nr:DUF6705 family protein [Lacinutrix venerupis]APY01394.1 hypothetical protein BWR22_14145 [Lacinutrix venerupis]